MTPASEIVPHYWDDWSQRERYEDSREKSDVPLLAYCAESRRRGEGRGSKVEKEG